MNKRIRFYGMAIEFELQEMEYKRWQNTFERSWMKILSIFKESVMAATYFITKLKRRMVSELAIMPVNFLLMRWTNIAGNSTENYVELE